jgi:uncharacterized protein YfiM (DUF2279 family)
MRLLFKTTLLLLIGLGLLLITMLIAITDSTPLVKPAPQVTPQAAHQVQRKAKELQFAIAYLRRHTISFSEDEIGKLFAVAARALPRLSGDAQITAQGSEIRVTFRLLENSRYLNLRLGLPASSQRLVIDHLSLGSLSLQGENAYALIEKLANLAFGSDEGTTLLKTIKQVRNKDSRILITYQPTPHLDEKIAAAVRRMQPWHDEMTTADLEAIRDHYQQLCNNYQRTSVTSLATPLSESLTLAMSRATTPEQAATENRAALLAMAIFFGTERFNTLINAIDNNTLKQCKFNVPATTLAGRKDLALHFIYSAAIKIVTDTQTSFAVGELKEMMDSLQGGSGFSFIDLTADQTGIRFAELAITPQSARQLQQIAAELRDEHRFFPSIKGLPESIPQRGFEQQYGGTGGDYYIQQLDEIKRRIDAVAVYRDLQGL